MVKVFCVGGACVVWGQNGNFPVQANAVSSIPGIARLATTHPWLPCVRDNVAGIEYLRGRGEGGGKAFLLKPDWIRGKWVKINSKVQNLLRYKNCSHSPRTTFR